MPESPNTFRYTFAIDDEQLSFEIDTSIRDLTATEDTDDALPKWTRLEHNQCICCPLQSDTQSHCPAAVRMHEALETFKNFQSVDKVSLNVETKRRSYQQECDLQSGLNSMLGLLMATSGCPIVGKLRTMATFHLPFSSLGETLYRTVGAYLTKQYFEKQDGNEPDWDLKGLIKFYEELEILNHAFSRRIRDIEQSDAISNAIVMFFASSVVVASALDERLEEYRDYFTGASGVSPDGD
ncbi:MAG: hypothetical protein AAF065_12595 [Verrucomicrobiota bacterium]